MMLPMMPADGRNLTSTKKILSHLKMTTTSYTYGVHARGRAAKEPVDEKSLIKFSVGPALISLSRWPLTTPTTKCDVCKPGFSYSPCHPGTYDKEVNHHIALSSWVADVAAAGKTHVLHRDGRIHHLFLQDKSLPRIGRLLEKWRYAHFGSTRSLKELRTSTCTFRVGDQDQWLERSNGDVVDPGFWDNIPIKDTDGGVHFIARRERMSSDLAIARTQWAVSMSNICRTLFGEGAYQQVPNPFIPRTVPLASTRRTQCPDVQVDIFVTATTELDPFDYDYDAQPDLELGF